MITAWKDIAVFLDATEQGQKVGRHAAGLAQQHKAHLVGVYGALRERGHPTESYARGAAVTHVIERHRHAEASLVVAAGRIFADLADAFAVSSEFRVVWREAADEDAPLRSLHCDLIVAGHPKPNDLPERWTAEHLLLVSGIPVLMIPRDWSDAPIGRTVVVAWNGSRAARRAVNDALPFLTSADRVIVLVVDGERNLQRPGDDLGDEIVRHLERHEVTAELMRIESQGAPVPDVISGQCATLNADLLVIGAYSHPRTSELLFGGVTRSLLAEANLPLFLSR
ncbi:universal stress protein [Brevundimonas sp. GCM10030266]|uniref:universal stress protein n=1 Tax=Brevundimonas sp. GCM10030266 TaxID=3273386 RepID=UPI00361DCAEC